MRSSNNICTSWAIDVRSYLHRTSAAFVKSACADALTNACQLGGTTKKCSSERIKTMQRIARLQQVDLQKKNREAINACTRNENKRSQHSIVVDALNAGFRLERFRDPREDNATSAGAWTDATADQASLASRLGLYLIPKFTMESRWGTSAVNF